MEPIGVRVLPRRKRRREGSSMPIAAAVLSTPKSGIAIVDQILRRLVPRERFTELLRCPRRRGVQPLPCSAYTCLGAYHGRPFGFSSSRPPIVARGSDAAGVR